MENAKIEATQQLSSVVETMGLQPIRRFYVLPQGLPSTLILIIVIITTLANLLLIIFVLLSTMCFSMWSNLKCAFIPSPIN